MAKKENTEQNQQDTAKTPPMLHIRLTGPVRADIAKKAEDAGRTLTKEVERRLEASLAVPETAAPTAGLSDVLVYGWANPENAKALGDALGMLWGHLEDYAPVRGQGELAHADRLAMFKVTIAKALDQLGASAKLSTEQTTFAEVAARQFMNDFQRVEPNAATYIKRSDLAVMARLAASFRIDKKE